CRAGIAPACAPTIRTCPWSGPTCPGIVQGQQVPRRRARWLPRKRRRSRNRRWPGEIVRRAMHRHSQSRGLYGTKAVHSRQETNTLRMASDRQFTINEKGARTMSIGYNSLLGLLILAADIWAIMNIFQSSASNERKLLWTLVVLILPVL